MTDTREITTNDNAIREKWEDYFNKLYTIDNLRDYDDTFMEIVEQTVNNIKSSKSKPLKEAKKYSNLFTISKQQVKNFIRKAETWRSPGYDGITFEHINNAGDELIEIMTHLFNMMLKTQ